MEINDMIELIQASGQVDEIMDATNQYMEQMSKCDSPEDATIQMFRILDETNEEGTKRTQYNEKISCKKGCAHCCHIKVETTVNEVKVIADYVKEHNIPVDQEKLRKQALIEDEVAYMFSPDKRCNFLKDDNTCAIYPVRPSNCRNYYVVNPPEDCDTDKHNSGRVMVHFDVNTLPPMFAIINTSEKGSFPKLLLDELNKPKI